MNQSGLAPIETKTIKDFIMAIENRPLVGETRTAIVGPQGPIMPGGVEAGLSRYVARTNLNKAAEHLYACILACSHEEECMKLSEAQASGLVMVGGEGEGEKKG